MKNNKKINLASWFITEAQNPDSVPGKFWDTFALNFIMDNLPEEKQKMFIDKVAEGDQSAREWVISEIPDFEDRLSLALGQKLAEIRAKKGEQ